MYKKWGLITGQEFVLGGIREKELIREWSILERGAY